jgi:hypothetical protein
MKAASGRRQMTCGFEGVRDTERAARLEAAR